MEAQQSENQDSTTTRLTDEETSITAEENSREALTPQSTYSATNYKHYLSLVSQNLDPGSEYDLWTWLQALRTADFMKKVTAELSINNIDLYRQFLTCLTIFSPASVAEAIEAANMVNQRAMKLGEILAKINILLQKPDQQERLRTLFLKLSEKISGPWLMVLRMNIVRKNIQDYLSSLIEVSVPILEKKH